MLTDDSAAKRSGSGYIAASTAFAVAHPETVTAVLGALEKASTFIAGNPDEAARITAGHTRAPEKTMRSLLDDIKFALALSDHEKTGFDEVAGSLARTGQGDVTFATGVSPQFLEQAVPGAVSYTK
ncbi:hypothetical protein KM176_20040 [Pseudooceanicola sp. CBS1P-1]|uniref:ABC transporter substrate-binding protein n=1 Tax=Pseudooceanicola albus TaxID=2692189 RepID=A0A6L7G6V0_9RHOB|nr:MULTISPECIES: hypothetical protein [Pseudooceanicola]MBT9386171.1 hypothetical protein [Pseudooceanicola endophyticus]MXN19412.1 hypothetical protein [Pseudooceanicola albus]